MFSLCEAESETAAAALQRFEGGSYNTNVMDISQVCCDELKKFENLLIKAGKLGRSSDMLLSGWSTAIRQVEERQRAISREIVQVMCRGHENVMYQMRVDVANRLLALSTGDRAKQVWWEARTGVRQYLNEYLIPRVIIQCYLLN